MFRIWMLRAMIAATVLGALAATSRATPRKRRGVARVAVLRFAIIDRPDLFYAYSRFVTPDVTPPPRSAEAAAARAAPVATEATPTSALARRCAKCHGGPAPKAALAFDGQTSLTSETRLAAIRRVLADDPSRRMPPGESLPPEELGLVLQELATPAPAVAGAAKKQ